MVLKASAIAGVAGAVGLAIFLAVAHLWLDLVVTARAILLLAVPLVTFPVACGAMTVVWFRRKAASALSVSLSSAVLYLALLFTLWVAIAAILISRPSNPGESFLAIPIFIFLCAFVGTPLVVASSLAIFRYVLRKPAHANAA